MYVAESPLQDQRASQYEWIGQGSECVAQPGYPYNGQPGKQTTGIASTEKGSKLAENSLQTVVDQQAKIISKLPDKEIDPMFKALKLYVEKYEEVLKETYVEL